VPEIEDRRKKPLPVRMLLWDGTNFPQVNEFAGTDGHGNRNAVLNSGILAVWNEQEQAWQTVPVGHRVVRSTLGELYPMSPEAYELTTQSAVGPAADITADRDRYREVLRLLASTEPLSVAFARYGESEATSEIDARIHLAQTALDDNR
jgi:hypothetical protein